MKKTLIIALGIFLPIFLMGSVFGHTSPKLVKMDTSFLRDLHYAPAEMVHQDWNEYTNSWENEFKISFHYNRLDFDLPVIDHLEYYAFEDGEWALGFEGFVEYNDQGFITNLYVQLEVEPDQFVNFIEVYAEYDAQNRLTIFKGYQKEDEELKLNFALDIQYNNWYDMIVYQYIYDSWEENEEDAKVVIELDDQDRMAVQTVYVTDDGGEEWYLSDKISISYHPQDTSSIVDYIDYISRLMPLLYLFGDDSMNYGMISEEYFAYWDDDSWHTYEKHVYEYNSLLQNIKIEECWPSYPDWYNYYSQFLTYDTHGNMTEILGKYNEDGAWVPDDKLSISYIPWTDVSDEHIPAIDRVSLQAYPQPFADHINLIAESKAGGAISIDIFNLKGQLVRSFNAVSGQNVIWDGKDNRGKNLPSSVYLMRANQDGISANKKIIKLK